MGSGAASHLPFHAACDSINKERYGCLDYVTSSYTPTLKALQHAKTRARALGLTENPSTLFVAMQSTPGQSPLCGVIEEKWVVESAVKGFCKFTSLTQPGSQDVLDEVPRSQIVHFACHGFSDPSDPSESYLLLQKKNSSGDAVVDGGLTVGRLPEATSESKSWIVYLSACSTAQVKAEELSDEGLHLASAFQIAGFAHAIGSLWSVADKICVDFSKIFYEEIASSGTGDINVVSRALKKAVMHVRDLYPDSPALWGPFIHYGA